MDIVLIDCFPYSLGDLPLDTGIADTAPIKFDIVFKVDSIKLDTE